MNNELVSVGDILYHYAYGRMKVVNVEDSLIHVQATDRSMLTEKALVLDSMMPTHIFYTEAIGHWIFFDIDDVGTEDSNFSRDGKPVEKLKVDDDLYFTNASRNNKRGNTVVESDLSGITASKNAQKAKKDNTSDISGITASKNVKNNDEYDESDISGVTASKNVIRGDEDDTSDLSGVTASKNVKP